MSYILDALRRADSERERERSVVPGLHAQAVPAGGIDADIEARPNPWKWLVAASFAALLGLVAWLWFDRASAPQAVAEAAPPPMQLAPPVSPAAPAPPAGAVTAAPGLAPAAPPAPTATAAAAAVTSSPPLTASAQTEPPQAPARKPPPATPRKPPAPKSVAEAPEPEPKVSKLAELPEEVRRELPSITVNGSTYSKSAANRMLVINGQVFREGDALATGLVLERIRQKSAVLRFNTYRYEINF